MQEGGGFSVKALKKKPYFIVKTTSSVMVWPASSDLGKVL